MFIVLREPKVLEDGNKYSFITSTNTEKQAKDVIARLSNTNDKYRIAKIIE